jgi:hypothetical protein
MMAFTKNNMELIWIFFPGKKIRLNNGSMMAFTQNNMELIWIFCKGLGFRV